ncbi:nitroreductase family protein [Inquilinus limosus]|uniref:nitroreductase family protein n=1 Tax=Inquilinus limosus TaxID=171674 RepID=UPI00041AC058|nr:nitroreductase family protein [Inquilinus limosus]
MTSLNGRLAEHDIDSLFLRRWSPRAFTEEAIPESELLRFFEAARWAPSAYNAQPWHFIYARRGTERWPVFLDILNEWNRGWAQHAAALVIVASKTRFDQPGKGETPLPTHAFDAGAAWSNFALQALLSGWHTHGMAGFDRDKARAQLGIPADYAVDAAIAVGRLGDRSTLPESLQAREHPSGRKPLGSIVSEGVFRAG